MRYLFEGTRSREFLTSIEPVDVVTLSEQWIRAELGRVPSEVTARLEEEGFDQAPVRYPESDLGWGLVSTTTLKALSRACQALEPAHLEPGDCGIYFQDVPDPYDEGVPAPWRLELLLDSLVMRSAGFVCLRYEPPVLTEEELGEEHEFKRLFGAATGVLGSRGTERGYIIGLMTRSDLNRRAVRAVLYHVLFELEERLSRFVQAVHVDVSEWIRFLREESQARVLGWWEVSRRKGIDLAPIHTATLTELAQVVESSQLAREKLGFQSATKVREALQPIKDVRNKVMHPVRPLVLGAEDVAQLKAALDSAQSVLEQLSGLVP